MSEQAVRPDHKQTRNLKPTSIYLSPDQLRKLDTLSYQINEFSTARIDRQDIIRHLVDQCSLADLQDLL